MRHRDANPRDAAQPKRRGRPPATKETIKLHPISKQELRSFILILARREAWVKRAAEQRWRATRKFQSNALSSLDAGRLDCSICLEILIAPVLLSCGHSFCQNCIAEAVFKRQLCPLCRYFLLNEELNLFVSPTTRKIVEAHLRQHKTQQDRNNYSIRMKEHEMARAEKAIPTNLQVGDRIDCWVDGEWLEAVIERQARDLLRVSPKKGQRTLKTVCLTKLSRRLARLNTYTVRKEPIPAPIRPPIVERSIVQPIIVQPIIVQPIEEESSQPEPQATQMRVAEAGRVQENAPYRGFSNIFMNFSPHSGLSGLLLQEAPVPAPNDINAENQPEAEQPIQEEQLFEEILLCPNLPTGIFLNDQEVRVSEDLPFLEFQGDNYESYFAF